MPRRVPSPVVEEADYIPYEDAVSSDGEVPRRDDMQHQMAEMRREMAVMHNFVHFVASTSAQPIVGPSTATAQQIAGPSSATIQPITGPSTSAAQPIAALSTGVGIVGERPNNMASFSSVPLGSLVDPKVKAKIWAVQFVKLHSLAGEFSESLVTDFRYSKNRNHSVQMRENVSRRLFNVAQWTDIFSICRHLHQVPPYRCSFHIEVCAACSLDGCVCQKQHVQLRMIGISGSCVHITTCRGMSYIRNYSLLETTCSIAYDRDFRKLRAHNHIPWDVIHQELFLALSYRN